MKANKYIILSFLSISVLLLSSCGIFNKKKGIQTSTDKKETFENFYSQFHDNITFQRKRIAFPDRKIKSVPTLTGFNDEGMGRVSWNSGNWIPHKAEMSSVDQNLYDVDIIQEKNKVIETLQ